MGLFDSRRAFPANVGAGGDMTSPERRRKLHAGHFAFMRALVQGLPAKDSWDRYLAFEAESSDSRAVRATITWIRQEFALAARREDRFGTARLIEIDVQKIPELPARWPTLAQFAEEAGLEDYSEAEQIEAYQARFGPPHRRTDRRQRLVAKQLDALNWLEGLVAQPPRAGDAIAAWLQPAFAARLAAADLFTLAQLVDRINGLGLRWAGVVKGIGEHKARRIVGWLKQHQSSIGMTVGAHVSLARQQLFAHELQQVVAPRTGVVPLEKLIVPAELDGSRGHFRRPQTHCLMAASNDHAATLAWLQSKQGLAPEQVAQARARKRNRDSGVASAGDWLQFLSHTQRAYRKEAERFLLWAIVQRGKPLSSMTTEDCIDYRAFLADPQPRSRWCAQRNRERWSPLWRPFEGPLSPSAQRQAITILRNLYAFWVDKNYVMGNPWSGVSVPRSSTPKVNAGRSFSMQQWLFIEAQLALLPQTSSTSRLRFALRLLYATGLRLAEVVSATVDHLQWVAYPPDADDDEAIEGWLLSVVGKGHRERQVPIPTEVVSELAKYLAARGLEPDPEDASNVGVYLLGKATDIAERAPALAPAGGVDAKDGVAANTLYDQIKRFFDDCAGVLSRQGDAKGAARFQRASTHWMRHTHASHSIARGTRVEIEQQILGHASLATTTIYVTTEQKRRLKAIQKFWKP